MTEQRANYLLSIYFRQDCTPEEQDELNQWIRDADEEGLRRVLAEVWADFSPVESIDDYRAQQMLSLILAPKASTGAGRVRRMGRRWMSAAAVLIVIAGGALSYSYFSGGKRAAVPAAPGGFVRSTVPKEDVLPGTTQATLTLDDGSAIVLDTVAGTAVALQGTTKIVKQNGRVVYKNDGPAVTGSMYNTLSTARGHQYPLMLSDGTKVWLNASSSIRFPVAFGEKERAVEITGEVYFEVAKSSKPFAVSAGGTRVQVLGTHFDINAYEDEARLSTTLLEGAIRITRGAASLVLAPGQQAQVQKNGVIDINRDADMEEAVSWTQGYFHFTDASLETVLRQLSRWYDVDVVYEKRSSDETFSGDIEKSLSLSQVLKILDKSQVKFRISGKRLIVIN